MNRVGYVALFALGLFVFAGRAPADDLPNSARKIVEDTEKDIQDIEKKADEAVRKAREALREAKQAVEKRKQKLLEGLQALEATLKKEGKLAQAKAVGEKIEEIKGGPALPDPGSLGTFRGQNGKVLRFEVTGQAGGSVWGTGVYTDDSSLATAAVHAGILKVGQKGVVKVTILPGQASYTGSSQNDITTSEYGSWSGSYKVEASR